LPFKSFLRSLSSFFLLLFNRLPQSVSLESALNFWLLRFRRAVPLLFSLRELFLPPFSRHPPPVTFPATSSFPQDGRRSPRPPCHLLPLLFLFLLLRPKGHFSFTSFSSTLFFFPFFFFFFSPPPCGVSFQKRVFFFFFFDAVSLCPAGEIASEKQHCWFRPCRLFTVPS